LTLCCALVLAAAYVLHLRAHRPGDRARSVVTSGKDIFAAACAPCHGADGGGRIGPNLTDAYWLHGGSPESIQRSVHDGWVDKGMPAWGPSLGEYRVREVAAYVVSLRGTNVAGGKPPQGTRE
jgi:cytochrome c oxidase cbb3-type subunit 3